MNLFKLISLAALLTPAFSAKKEELLETGVVPGLGIRLEEKTFQVFKQVMQDFLPTYIQNDAHLPTEYHYKFGFNTGFLSFLTTWEYTWKKITYSQERLDFADMQLKFTNRGKTPQIGFDFPVIHAMEINAFQESNSWIAPKSHVELFFHNLDIKCKTGLQLLESGYLKPSITNIQVNFGATSVKHDNFITTFFMRQVVDLALVIIENSSYFLGQYVYSEQMEPILTYAMNDYRFPFVLPNLVTGQDKTSELELDVRHTYKPYIGNGVLELYMIGELMFDNKSCGVNFKEVPMTFLDDDKFSQVILTESALSCIANSLSHSNHGQIEWNQDKFLQFFVGNEKKLDTNTFGAQISAIKRSFRKNQPMKIRLGFKDWDVQIGQYDTDLIASFVLKIGLHLDSNDQELIYDELPVVLSTNVNAKNDVVFPKFINFKIIHNNDRHRPIRNSLKMTAPEYREFVSVSGFFFNYCKKYMNEVYMKDGLRFPYTVDELDTELKFDNKLMYVMIDMTERLAKELEENFWKSDKDPK